MLRVLDLFSGIGGFSLGLERTGGFETVAFCEIDSFCRRVLAKHWPKVPCYDDVRELTGARLAADGIAVDVICGGFPCQDISCAGNGAGLAGERSGLWREYARLIGDLRPRFVVVENVAALLGRGLGEVLGDLASLGYDADWNCIPAAALGAPHRRDRVWIVAYPDINGCDAGCQGADGNQGNALDTVGALCEQGLRPVRAADVAHASRQRRGEARRDSQRSSQRVACGGDVLADADGEGLQDGRQAREPQSTGETIRRVALTEFERCGGAWWSAEPDVGRVAYGIPSRVDRLRSLGNAVVPQIPEMIGRAILQAEAA